MTLVPVLKPLDQASNGGGSQFLIDHVGRGDRGKIRQPRM
jgi:hypothetical protein